MTATHLDLSRAAWRKSTHSNNGGNCIEVTPAGPGIIAVRDSTDPAGPRLAFTPDQWQAFAAALKNKPAPAGQVRARTPAKAKLRRAFP